MKKAILSAVVVGVSALYIFFEPSAASVPAVVADVNAANPATTTTQTIAAAAPPPPTPTQTPTPTPTPTPPAPKPQGQYKDGTYTGALADAYYGYVEVKATVAGGKLTDVTFLSYPSDRSTSRYINSQAMPYLTQEAISAQSANVDIISGATDTSIAFRQSLASALASAKNS